MLTKIEKPSDLGTVQEDLRPEHTISTLDAMDTNVSNKKIDLAILAGDTGDIGDKTEQSININDLVSYNLSPKVEKVPGTIGDKPLFELIEGKKGLKNGVYYNDITNEGPPKKIWICSPLKVLAETRNISQQDWGWYLSWKDNDGHDHHWACPAEILQATDQSEFRRILASGGLAISVNPKSRKLLCEYVLTHRTDMKARCVDRIGWNGGQYILTNRVIGTQSKELLVYQGAGSGDFSTNGTLKEWQENVAVLAVGNSRITFAIACAFAGVLVEPAGESGGGFQFTGETSKGKTSTLIGPAAGVWGHPDQFANKWRATVNGLESICLARNHNITILDDLGQIEPSEAGQAAYLIANGQARLRMNKDTSARRAATWKTMLLSSGEIDLSRHIESIGKRAKGGQVARLPSIPADTGSGWYSIEDLHGCNDGREFSAKIKTMARQYYGTAGIAFLEKVTGDYETICSDIKASLENFIKTLNLPDIHAPETGRIAERFALVAYAGELATHYGVTGWTEGEAMSAATKCFNAWLERSSGAVGHEDLTLLNQVSTYIQTYGASRFPSLTTSPEELARFTTRSGFTRTESGETQYLVETGAFKDQLCKGIDTKYAIKTLIKRGWLIPGGDDRPTQKPRIPALNNKTIRVYVIDSKAIEGELNG